MKKIIYLTIVLVFSTPHGFSAQVASILHLSHNSTVRIISLQGNSSGTGFMVGDRLVLTCFHVVARTERDNNGMVSGVVFTDLKVTMPSGEIIDAEGVSKPTPLEPTPLLDDFAYLKLKHKPSGYFEKLSFATDSDLNLIDLGDDVAFSGYPLSTPAMVTHKGGISGFTSNKNLLCIQASVNKGNSGGALVNRDGKIIGIVTLREGGITQGLANLRGQIAASDRNGGSVHIMGIDTLASTKMLIDTIDQYISVGIGYAVNVKFSRDYLEKHPELNN